jgi:hypothetical protein
VLKALYSSRSSLGRSIRVGKDLPWKFPIHELVDADNFEKYLGEEHPVERARLVIIIVHYFIIGMDE